MGATGRAEESSLRMPIREMPTPKKDANPDPVAEDEYYEPEVIYGRSEDRAALPVLFEGDPEEADGFVKAWDEWRYQLSPQFSQYQYTTIFLSLIRPPVDRWARDMIYKIEQWREEGMDDDDDMLLEDVIGRFMDEFVPRDDVREEYDEDVPGAEDPEDERDPGYDFPVGNRREGHLNDWEVSPPPSLFADDKATEEESPDEAEEYVEEYSQEDLVDDYYETAYDVKEPEERVPLPRRTRADKERTSKGKKRAAKKSVLTPQVQELVEATWDLYDQNPEAVDYIVDTLQEQQAWDGPNTFTTPAATWDGPETFYTPPPPDPTPASWGSAEADAAQEARAAKNTGWFAYQSNPDAMDLTAGRARAQAKAKCHHCWQTGHTRRNCPNQDSPRHRSWMEDYNDDDSVPCADLPRADNRRTSSMPRAVPPRADNRGRSHTVKTVYASDRATYAPTTRHAPTTVVLPRTPERRAATPLPSPISDVGFKPIQHPSPVPLSEDQLVSLWEDLSISRAAAYRNQDAKLVKRYDDWSSWVKKKIEEGKPQETIDSLERRLRATEHALQEAKKKNEGFKVQKLDRAANKIAGELLKRDISYHPAMDTTENVLRQRGRCFRREGNVTVSPVTGPPNTPARPRNTAVKRSRAEKAEEEVVVMGYGAWTTQQPAKSRDFPNYHGFAQEYWE
ncbi:hypothetical protein EDB92DRAFT_1960783 [Lactarius akahatsu]|uniref:CCHC-type domain-containing protein n=1 Tax=Lactarius akahatsu TaxID=416441 RepID=A0AAD4Q4G0_9AGAM|nr:hypothetical protein EDB92DRAFT_1960783 [Lactarius akahatsu]